MSNLTLNQLKLSSNISKSEEIALSQSFVDLQLSPDLGFGVPDVEYVGPPGPGVDLDGTFDDDVLSGTREADTINGGTAGRDHIFGYDGNDTLNASIGSDVEGDYIYGGSGNDFIQGSNMGDDYLFGGTGNDLIRGGDLTADQSNDSIYGHDGNDTLFGGSGADRIEGGNGDDEINGGNGFDSLYGNAGADLIDGSDSNDLIEGNDGNDSLLGGRGSDTIRGGDGDDLLFGVALNDNSNNLAEFDELSGGAGADQFRLGDSDSVFYFGEKIDGNGYVEITDFSNSQGDLLLVFGSTNDYEFEFVGGSTNITYDGDLIAQVNGAIDPATDVQGL